jgi:hypothetical protein
MRPFLLLGEPRPKRHVEKDAVNKGISSKTKSEKGTWPKIVYAETLPFISESAAASVLFWFSLLLEV